MIKILIIF